MGQSISKVFEFGFQPNQSTEIPWHYVTREVDINNDATGIFSLPLGFAMSGLVIDEAQRPPNKHDSPDLRLRVSEAYRYCIPGIRRLLHGFPRE